MSELYKLFELYWLEGSAVIVSLLGVYLTAKEKILCWPIGILGCLLYTLIFYKAALYADAALQVFYFVISFYGWYEWLYGGNSNPSKDHEEKKQLLISNTSSRTYIYLGIIAPVSSIVLIALLFKINDSLPYWDGITFVLSIIATWMMARKLIEHWILWIIIDLLYITPYIIKGLFLTALLYFIFTLLAIYGYYVWKRKMRILYA